MMQPEEHSNKLLSFKKDITNMKILRFRNHKPVKVVSREKWYKHNEVKCSEENSASFDVIENEHNYSKRTQDIHCIYAVHTNLVDSQSVTEENLKDPTAAFALEDVFNEETVVSKFCPEKIKVEEENQEDSSADLALEDVFNEETVVSKFCPEKIKVEEENQEDSSADLALEDILDEETVVLELCPENIKVKEENQEDVFAAHSLQVILNEEVEFCPEKRKVPVHTKRVSYVDRAAKVSSEQLLCEICGRVLGSRQALRKHLKSQHLNSPGKFTRKRVDIILPEVHLSSTNFDQLSTSVSHFPNTIAQLAESTIQHSSKTTSDTFGQLSETISTSLDDKSSRISLQDENPDSMTNEDNIVTMYKCEADSTSGPNKTHFCDICGKGFTCKYTLRTHKSFHTGIRPFGCQYCPKSFKTKGQRQAHERRHFKEVESVKPNKGGELEYRNKPNNVKKEVCDLCGQLFVNKYVLATHKKFHSGVRPYSCRLCAKTFKTKGQVKVHENRHIL